MEKIISNRCNEQGSAYITLSDILGGAIHYDSNGKFEYIQSSSGSRYKDLQGARVDINLRLTDPTAEADQANILAKNAAKSVEIKVDPKVESCIKINQKNISIDTTRHGCSIEKLLGTNDTIKITLKGNMELNREFAQLGGSVSFTSENCKWINLGLNECELSQHKVKITNDCKCNKLDTEAFKEHRNDITVKSEKSGEKVGSVNLASWFFKNDELHYDLRGDGKGMVSVGKDNIYLKVLLCDKQKPYCKLALCDKNGNIVAETQKSNEAVISRCNITGGQEFQLRDYVRDDNLPSFIIKPSTSKEFGEAISNKSRAEVYEYNPISHDIGGKIGKLNATDIRLSGKTFIIDNLLLNDNGYKTFNIDSNNITVKEENGVYHIDKPFRNSVDEKTTKLLLDDLLCLFDQNSLQDVIQIIG